MSHRIHVIHVLGTGEQQARGISLTVENLARTLDPHQYRLSVIFLRSDGPVGDAFRKLGMDVRTIDWRGGRGDIAGALRFARALRAMKPAIVHLHAGGLSPRFVSKAAAGARVVVHYHSLEEESRADKRRRAVRTPMAADLVIANSRATAKSVTKGEPLVVYPGVNVLRKVFRRTPHETIVVGIAARLVPVKGISYLIESLALLARHSPPIRLEIAGHGPERLKLEAAAARAGVADRVAFLGWVDDVPSAMDKWDIVALPSLAEGLGIAALEAMARGIPVVATQVGGLSEIIVDGRTGFLVPPKDPQAMADRISQLAKDPALRAKLGNAARERAADLFSVERESQAIQSAYQSLLA
ncbi:MAG TPA: glycosyltransferase [Gemmatimonadaceae bacterium]|nr:glycosyltransferase [Gemmatimonadaceae bacterium]